MEALGVPAAREALAHREARLAERPAQVAPAGCSGRAIAFRCRWPARLSKLLRERSTRAANGGADRPFRADGARGSRGVRRWRPWRIADRRRAFLRAR